MPLDIAPLLAPISADHPTGTDVSYDPVFDQIREARRADDPQLDQGEWQTELKVADWRTAQTLAEQVLRAQSKDLQAAVWLAEAWVYRHGLEGASAGFALVQGLLEQYWEQLHPRIEDDDLDERAGKLAWLNQAGHTALLLMPLGGGGQDRVTLADWQTSREVDNLARQNRAAYEAALAEGKRTGEAIDSALASGGATHIRAQLRACEQARQACQALAASVDQHFGRAAPSLAQLSDTLARIEQVLTQAGKALGVSAAPNTDHAAEPIENNAASGSAADAGTPTSHWQSPGTPMTQQQARAQALRTLGEIASFFHRSEPHSPVTSLLERAIAWADMPLEQWLQEVVRDDGTLNQIRDRVGLPRSE